MNVQKSAPGMQTTLLTSSIVSTQPLDFTGKQPYSCSPQCQLLWRQGQLLVRPAQDVKQPYFPALESEKGLVRCLKHSPVGLVRIDATLGEATLQRWANACEQAGKPLFVWGTVGQKLKDKPTQLSWCLRRLIDSIAALLLLMLLSPVMLGIVVLMYVYAPGAIFSFTWRVGARGRLFRTLKFRTTKVYDDSRTTALGRWMRNYGLDELPQLFNVLRAEMSLVRPNSLALSEVVQLNQLNAKSDGYARLS